MTGFPDRVTVRIRDSVKTFGCSQGQVLAALGYRLGGQDISSFLNPRAKIDETNDMSRNVGLMNRNNPP